MPHWTRRRLLRALLYGAGAAAVLLPAARHPRAPAGPAPLRGWLAELLPDTASAAAVGAAYLAEVPGAAPRARALGRLLCEQPDAAARRALLRERRSRDFASEDLVVIDGWVLAATEAQLCALARGCVRVAGG